MPPPSTTNRIDAVISEKRLKVLDAVPVGIQIVTYAPPAPKNFWANHRYLDLMGMTLEEFQAEDLSVTATDLEKSEWERRYQTSQVCGENIVERVSFTRATGPKQMEVVVQPILFELKGQNVSAVLITGWPVESESEMEANTKYMTSLLECSPYPLLFFTFDGHLITCNPAARKVFGTTIWLQSDIFGMDERERRGLPGVQQQDGSFRIERTERRTAYDSMMDALGTDGASFEVDLPMRRPAKDGGEDTLWYCRVLAQRHSDPVTGAPIIMVSHQDVTNLRKVEGELGRMQMLETTEKELMKHDSDVAGSLLVLLGEDWVAQNQVGVIGNMKDDSASWSRGSTQSQSTGFSSGVGVGSARPAGPESQGYEDNRANSNLHGLRECLTAADSWRFNVFELEAETDGLPLQVLAWHLFVKHDLIKEFNLDHVKLVSFLRHIEAGHHDNPYHNSTHVADVLQSFHWLVLEGGVRQYITKFEVLCGIIASIVHDFEHKGFNNDFLIKTQDEWAIDSNDRSPNENHHLAAAFRILRDPESNFIHRMPATQQAALRKLVIDLVLATDMAEHIGIVSKLKTDLLKQMETAQEDELTNADNTPDVVKTLILQGAIKVADIGHLYAQQAVHIQWAERLEEEMWLQGDVEKDREMKMSFLMDRDKPGVTKSQPGFVDFVVRPLFETWVACFPRCNVLMNSLNDNYAYWKSKEGGEAK